MSPVNVSIVRCALPCLRNMREKWDKVFDVIAEDTMTDPRFRMEVRPAPMEHR